ncbi:SBF-like CPA transporter family-domain-containing protein [Radiomyces spectabilis]|uniref:SBF-like CPA transporter family-domain-containing protein n=1 Tax=Radiomyces spectabilis TaxID=64574 RepID=UPI0022206CE6|nr:SBF-like CPA transporter family-domain-containing protein [Radiomyces spectabilis]KAI8393896.1 SBF-like CPA transporter family-domain-containing protein [Radiomyces spectabilis]
MSNSTTTLEVVSNSTVAEQTYQCSRHKQSVLPARKWNHACRTLVSLLQRYWFLLGLAVVIGLAWAFPQVGKTHGDIEAQYTIKWGAVIIIFLLSGLGLEVRIMFQTILRWRLHLVVQIINFLLLPFLAYGIVRFFVLVGADIDELVYQGWMIALSTSTTVSSNAVMTRNANGNESAALFNAALGNVLGIFISPALMTIFGDDKKLFPPGSARGTPDYTSVLKNLGLTVLVPLVVGQVIRSVFPKQVKYLASKFRFSIINSIALLCMVWSVFCDGVASDAFHQLTAVDIVAIIGVDIFLYLFGCATCLFVARLPWPHRWIQEPEWVKQWRFSRKDAIAIMYCGATKTVSMGIPLINVLYADSSYGIVGVLSLPLLMYHISQLFIGNFQVHPLKRWVEQEADEVQEEQHGLTNNPQSTSLPTHTTRRRPNTEATA